jgi:hypothetical protein
MYGSPLFNGVSIGETPEDPVNAPTKVAVVEQEGHTKRACGFSGRGLSPAGLVRVGPLIGPELVKAFLVLGAENVFQGSAE